MDEKVSLGASDVGKLESVLGTIPKREEYAAGELARLLRDEPGRLKIITAQHLCGCTPNGADPKTDDERDICEAHEFPLTDARHFVWHDVVSIEGPNARGQFQAFSEEGDWTIGQPYALLKRLLETFDLTMKLTDRES